MRKAKILAEHGINLKALMAFLSQEDLVKEASKE